MIDSMRTNIAVAMAVLAAVAGTAWGATPEDTCEAAKNQESGKYAFCRAKAEAKAIKTGLPPDYSKCDTKLLDKWAKAEDKAIAKGAACIDAVSYPAIQSFVTAHTDAVASALDGGVLPAAAQGQRVRTGQTDCWDSSDVLTPCAGTGQDGDTLTGLTVSFTDNGDGTITDNRTGLVWEKLARDGSIHEYSTEYTWHTAATKIAALNGGGGFAGYTDWRLPNISELQSLANFGAMAPAVDAPFHTGCIAACTVTTCSCTQFSRYWSATSRQDNPTFAWNVSFTHGVVEFSDKTGNYYVRAVRSGS